MPVKSFHRHLLLMLLVPLMLARGLLPGGFMVSFEEGQAQWVMCPADGPVPMPAGHEHHHHHHRDNGTPSTGHDAGKCPFASAAGAAVQPTIVAFAPAVADADAAVSIDDFTFERGIVARAHPIRGPPHLS